MVHPVVVVDSYRKIVGDLSSSGLEAKTSKTKVISYGTESKKSVVHSIKDINIVKTVKTAAIFLLWHCLSVPKVIYILRSSQCYIDQESIQGIDNAITVAAREICNVAFDADAWTIATMPVKYVGLSLRLSTDVTLPAYLASTAISKDFDDLMLSTNSYHHENAKMAHWDSTPFPVPNKPSIQSIMGCNTYQVGMSLCYLPLQSTPPGMHTVGFHLP